MASHVCTHDTTLELNACTSAIFNKYMTMFNKISIRLSVFYKSLAYSVR